MGMDGLKGDNRMDLIINTFGAYLHRSGEMFVVKVGDKVREESVRKIRSIIISEGATLSTDVIKLAIERNIDIVFLDLHGDLLDEFGMVGRVQQ
jgi:CRISPR-associated protein Cas1